MSTRRLTRTEASKTLTCLEVLEQGILSDFKLVCSGCDYYRNNISLNLMAQKKPRPQLSKFWQCCTPHNYGELLQSTPYQPKKLSKYNVLLTSDRSGNKRTCISSPATAADSFCSPTDPSLAAILRTDRNGLLADRSIAIIQREVALAEQNKICKERDRMFEKYNAAKKELEEVKLELAATVLQQDRYSSENSVKLLLLSGTELLLRLLLFLRKGTMLWIS
jgi:hypothetical protein